MVYRYDPLFLLLVCPSPYRDQLFLTVRFRQNKNITLYSLIGQIKFNGLFFMKHKEF